MSWEAHLNAIEREQLKGFRAWLATCQSDAAKTRRLINMLRKRAQKRSQRLTRQTKEQAQ